MNETLCRALLQARLTEEDVAAQPAGGSQDRPPVARGPGALSAASLGAGRAARLRRGRPVASPSPYAVQAGGSPGHLPAPGRRAEEVWLRLFRSAEREIGILADTIQPLASHPRVLAALAAKARGNVRMRICLASPDVPVVAHFSNNEKMAAAAVVLPEVQATFAGLRATGHVEFRLTQNKVYASIYQADSQLIISHRAYGISISSAPALHLRQVADGDIAATYLAVFADTWSNA